MIFKFAAGRLYLPTTNQVFSKANFFSTSKMAKSKFDYVRNFELDDKLLQNSWIVIRIDGKGFHKFSDAHEFTKPNDVNALNLMNKCARAVLDDFNEIILAYGQSDEYSFVFRRDTQVYGRRSSKLITNISSLFASRYVFHWPEFFPDKKLKYPPCFDGRAVLYPSERNIRDYLSWRQADCHINNLYNTVFWTLIQKGGMTPKAAQERLSGTLSGEKNEILFSEFDMNYNNEPNQFKKGTTIIKRKEEFKLPDGSTKMKNQMVDLDCDIIGDSFWTQYPHLLEPYRDL
eukprot:TRINITY_DN4054_c0_g1_i6.p1 TRINITY_DN4054_c0_g1~~TRINITY_DN4054_c0_g1_i6.p1  ORF type:complete len:288 (-),score=34.30 TRINITY_DN4054_c0_g1_i6:224-1087(-)